MRPQLILSALLIGCSSLVAANSKGAPACIADAALMTKQTIMGKEAVLGYTVSAKEIANGYTPGKAIKVTVGSVKTFNGILLYAVDEAKNHVGTFDPLPKGLQYKDGCKGDNGKGTLTHADATPKPQMDILWIPPKAGTGSVTFISTFVAGKALGFQMAKSIAYKEIGGTPKGTDTAAPPADTNTPTASPPAGSTPSPTGSATPTTASNSGMSVSQYSSFGALAIANIAAAFMLL